MNAVDFQNEPPIGTTLLVDGQRYELTSVKPHRCQDGSRTVLLDWCSRCPDCGRPFVVTTGLKGKYINRRCQAHRQPGKAVSAVGRQRQSHHLARRKP